MQIPVFRCFFGWHWNCSVYITMNEILFCTHNPMLIKNLYGIMRDEGYSVDIADHPAVAVRMALERKYSVAVMDAEPFGLSAEDAVRILKAVSPDITVIMVGYPEHVSDATGIRLPADPGEVRRLIHGLSTESKSLNY
ncbi:MAG: hypothetical protein HZA17_07155 [Nitrospirae bacterium]|nr:hypothetical protein [Nitrospirota bacterium]